MSNHYHFHAKKKTTKNPDRTKHGPTRTRKSHLYNRGPYFQPGPGMGDFVPLERKRVRFRTRIANFFRKYVFRKTVKTPSEKSNIQKVRIASVNAKPIVPIRATTRVRQRKGER